MITVRYQVPKCDEDYTTPPAGAEKLSDKTADGRERPWRRHKLEGETLADIYDEGDISEAKAERLRRCGNYLEFAVLEDGSKRLQHADFCRVRLCPICTWRRSLKIRAQAETIMQRMEADKPYQWVMLTLTLRNVRDDELADTISRMVRGWHKLQRRKDIKALLDAGAGWHRSLEVTHNVDPMSPSYDTYHPHYHVLWAMPPDYCRGGMYVDQCRWRELWASVMGLDYDPRVDVRRAYARRGKTIAEAIKYATKAGDYIVPDDWELSVDAVRTLDAALHQRKLSAFGGSMLAWHKRLNLDDAEDGDLVHTDDDKLAEQETRTISYWWYAGYRQYYGG